MADEKVVSATQLYQVRTGAPVVLAVVIGEAQVGGTNLRLNGAPVVFDKQLEPVLLGAISPPAVLDCVTLVQDVNPATNRTTVTYVLTGGIEDKAYLFTLEASEKGRVRYEISFLFF
jgi:hypothetical protein